MLNRSCLWLICALGTWSVGLAQQPIADENLVFAEQDGLLAVEAEHFVKQTATERRAFHLVSAEHKPDLEPDGDPPHIAGASGGA